MFTIYKFTCTNASNPDGSPVYTLTTPALGAFLVNLAGDQGWNLSAGNQYGGLYHDIPENIALWFQKQGVPIEEDSNCGCSECNPSIQD
jgi:hypothetical protein